MSTKEQVEKIAFVLEKNVTQPEQVMKPIVANTDGNGYMETVTFVHDTTYTNRTDIYAVETKKQSNNKVKTTKKWKQTTYGGAIYFPGTLANIDEYKGAL